MRLAEIRISVSMRATLPLCPECRCLLVLSKELPSRTYSQSATVQDSCNAPEYTAGRDHLGVSRNTSAILTDGQGVTVSKRKTESELSHTAYATRVTSSYLTNTCCPAGCASGHGDAMQASTLLRERGKEHSHESSNARIEVIRLSHRGSTAKGRRTMLGMTLQHP